MCHGLTQVSGGHTSYQGFLFTSALGAEQFTHPGVLPVWKAEAAQRERRLLSSPVFEGLV